MVEAVITPDVEIGSFSLLDKKWIECENLDGLEVYLSIRDVFDGAHQVKMVRGDSPTQDYAVLRVLLAIYWRAHRLENGAELGGTSNFKRWFSRSLTNARNGKRDQAVLDYLDAFADRFDLFHPETPFMQVADLKTEKDSSLPIRRIVPEADDEYFSMRAGQGRDTLTPAEAARWVIHTQAYDYSGIKSGAVGDPRVKGGKGYPIGVGWSGLTGGTYALGATLLETLALNTTEECLAPEADKPVWERTADGPHQREDITIQGPSDLATWQSRRIRLHHENGVVHSVLVCNGDQIAEAGANAFGDTMTPYRFSKNKSKKGRLVFYPKPYENERTVWRSLESLICAEGDLPALPNAPANKRPVVVDSLAMMVSNGVLEDESFSFQLVSSIYGPQSSLIADVVAFSVGFPSVVLKEGHESTRTAVIQTAAATRASAQHLGVYAGRLLVAAGGMYEFQATPTDSLLNELEGEFLQWLQAFDVKDPKKDLADWETRVFERVLGAGEILLRGAGPRAMVGTIQGVDSEGQGGSLISAGTEFQRLRRRLVETLPRAQQSQRDVKEKEKERTES